MKAVTTALGSKNKYTIVQVAPAVRATLGEEYNMPLGTDVTGKMVTGLRRLGFKKVFDTNFAADLTIWEEANELIQRIQNNRTLPMFTSCCPGWVKYMETNHPDSLDHLSSCKSPHEMEGAVLKTYYAKKLGIDPKDVFVVSIMPCTVKKFEAKRSELSEHSLQDVDAVMTTRELVRFFEVAGIDFEDLNDGKFDDPLGESTGAAVIFGTSGGVMEAALRNAYYTLTGNHLETMELNAVRGLDGIKEATIKIGELDLRVAVVNGIGQIGPIIDEIEAGTSKYHFIEVMSCPGGCINGGGQPIHQKTDKVIQRMKALYEMDKKMVKRRSYENESIKTLYKEFLIEPGSHVSHEILHTSYHNRKN
jgi:iron-only hydrogenase group A